MPVNKWKNRIKRKDGLRLVGGVYSPPVRRLLEDDRNGWMREILIKIRLFYIIIRLKKMYHGWTIRRKIKKSIDQNYKDLYMPLYLGANLPPLSLAAKKESNFSFPQRKVTKETLKPRLGLRRILASLTENPNSHREDRADFRPLVSAESVASPYARLKNFAMMKISALGGSAFGGKNSTIRRAVAVITLLATLTFAYFQSLNPASGAQFNFDQTQWRATPTGGNAAHPGDQSNFTDYTSKSANISLTGGGGPYNSATLSTSSNTAVQTTDADFNGGTKSQTTVASNSVQVSPEPGVFGSGADGAWTISSAKNINTQTNGNGGRTCADGISYNITGFPAQNQATLSATPPAGCFAAGDQVMILNEQGDGTVTTNVGNYEIMQVQSISTNVITFTGNKTKYYGNGASDDKNIGITANSTSDNWTNFDPTNPSSNIGAGGSLVYPGSGNYIYAFQGGGNTSFLAYSLTNNNWTTFDPTDAPDTIGAGGSLVYPGSGDYIYAFRGGSSGTFWAYSISNNNWTTFDPTDAPNSVGSGGSLVYPGSGDYIYAFRGGQNNDFWAYSIANNNWTTFNPTDPSPAVAVYRGASLVYPGAGDYIYALTGNASTNFIAYSLTNNNWTTFNPTDAPATVGGSNADTGNLLVYPGSGDYIYAFRGASLTTYWAYSISNNNWTTFDPTDAPNTVYHGGTLAYPGTGDYIFAFRGGVTSDFWAYSLKRQRVILQRIPQYTNVTIQSGGSLTANAWDGTKGGVLAFLASGTVDVQSGGSITATEKGYRATTYNQGESYNKLGASRVVSNNLGGGGDYFSNGGGGCFDGAGGGGGYGTAGSPDPSSGAAGGSAYGNASLSKLFFGSASGGEFTTLNNGGGIVYVSSSTLTVSGSISSDSGTYGSAGGSVYLRGDSLSVGTSKVTASGGIGGSNGGDPCTDGSYVVASGGVGRIHLKSSNITGTTTPTADTSSLPTTYYASGTLTSSVIDPGQKMVTGTFNWNDTIPGDSSITMEARGAVASGDVSGKSWCSISKGASIFSLATSCVETNSRYMQYRATLNSTSDQLSTPTLSDATLSYTYYPTGQAIVSSWYNTTDSTNLLSKIIWDENATLPTGTTIEFQAQTAPDSSGSPGTGTGFVGPDGTSGTYFSNADGNCSKPALSQTVTCNVPANIQIGDGTNDQWISYKAYLNSDGANPPQLDDAKLQYVVNATPAVSNVAASENSSGVLNITYDVADSDNGTQNISFGINTGVTLADNPLTSGATTINLSGNYSNLLTGAQTIQIDQEQITCASRSGAVLSTCTRAANNTRASSHTQNSIVWFVNTAPNATGAGAGITNGTGKIATWNIKADLSGVYYGTATLRVMANDGQLANQMSLASGATSASFNLDTKNPTSVVISFDRSKSSAQIAIGATDDSTDNVSYAVTYPNAAVDGSSDPCDFTTPAWQSFTYPSQTITIADNGDLVRKACVAFKDKYGNISTNTNNFAITPKTPESFQYYDVSNPSISDYRFFLSWGVPENTAEGKESGANGFSQYEVQRCRDLVGNAECSPTADYLQITSKLENYFADTCSDNYCGSPPVGTGLDPAYRYCYRFRIKDQNPDPSGDFSKWSESLCAVPGSGTSSLNKNVSIHFYPTAEENVPTDKIFTTQATIRWQTVNAADPNEALLTNSTVWWRELGSGGWTESYSLASYVEDHAVTIPGKLAPNKTYEYMVTSATPWETSDTQQGTVPATFTTKTGPVIENVVTSDYGNTNATIEWDTRNARSPAGSSVLATSIVYYSTAIGADGNLVTPQTGSCPGGYDTHHVCTLSSLISGRPYYYYVYSVLQTDPDGYSADTNGGNFYAFTTTTDTTPPTITVDPLNPNPIIITDAGAVLSFTTNERAKSWILYDTASHTPYSFPSSIFNPADSGDNPYADYLENTDLQMSHMFAFDGTVPLLSNTTYYYRIVSEDTSGNTTVSAQSTITTKKTQVDQHDPLGSISTPASANNGDSADITISHSFAYVSWTTNQVANQALNCSLDAGGPYTLSTSELTSYNKKHALKLPNLTADTKYYCKVTSVDDLPSPTTKTSNEFSFTTLKDPTYQHDPLSQITDITDPPAVRTDTKAVVKFNTDQAAQCVIEYGTETGNYTEVPITESLYNFNHSMHITGLIFSTPYFYRITCTDNLTTTISSAEYAFTTTEQMFTSTEWGTQGDTTPPVISGVGTSSVTGESVTVAWDTDEVASSSIKYGIVSGTYENMAGNSEVNSLVENYVTAHTVIINNLTPATKYYYIVASVDASGNIGESSESSFTTAAPSSLSSINVVSKNINEVTITWETSKTITSVVEYGLTNLYGETKTNNQLSKTHEVVISGLTSSQLYHFRVKGKDDLNNWFSSGDYTFQPKSPPQIAGVNVVDVTEHGAKVRFTTNVPTDALVTYTDSADNQNSGSQGKPDLSTSHEVELKSLKQGTAFALTVKVRDADGNETTQVSQNFTTGKDESPPAIDQVRTDSALAQNDKVQTIISWTTNEAATTQFIYKESRGGQEKEVNVSRNLSLNHVAVITVFKPGVVYYFKVKSVDESSNEGLSSEYALLTPKRKENVIQIIINNFEQIFSWAKR